MEYVWNYKKRCLEQAKCRHCKLFVWSDYKVYVGYCQCHRERRSNSAIACSSFDCKEWLVPPKSVVQLNLFTNEKSV